MAVLAATIIPQFSSSTNDAKDSSLEVQSAHHPLADRTLQGEPQRHVSQADHVRRPDDQEDHGRRRDHGRHRVGPVHPGRNPGQPLQQQQRDRRQWPRRAPCPRPSSAAAPAGSTTRRPAGSTRTTRNTTSRVPAGSPDRSASWKRIDGETRSPLFTPGEEGARLFLGQPADTLLPLAVAVAIRYHYQHVLLPRGVMVTQGILVPSFKVRVLAG